MNTIQISTLALAALLTQSTIIRAAEYTNECHDTETNMAWERMVINHPYDVETRHLHDLRRSLCEQIDQGEISLKDAINTFEQHRQDVIKERIPTA